MSAHLLKRLSAMELELRQLRAASIALRDDLLRRAEWDGDCRVVCAGSGVWIRFNAAINARDSGSGPEGENSRSEVEAESPQSGLSEDSGIAHPPFPSEQP